MRIDAPLRVQLLAILVLALSGLSLWVVFSARVYFRELGILFPERRAVLPCASSGLRSVRAIAFADSTGARLAGCYVPSQNGGAVVLVHGAGGDRHSLDDEARLLAARGFGVLAFDLPGHGESDGEIHWGPAEARAMAASLDFLATVPDVDPHRIGAFGFSMGGAVVARVASREPRIAAVVLAGTPSDQEAQVRNQERARGSWGRVPALFAIRRRAPSLLLDKPVDHVAAIAPRPLLIVTGELDTVVPPVLAENLFAAAREPKELLRVQGAAHGGYAVSPPYRERLAAFFEAALARR
jgi:pimeloyl-ACP methyl ester carboxylesterase